MTQSNPFAAAQQAPATPQQAAPQAGNPFGAPPAAPAPAQTFGNPFPAQQPQAAPASPFPAAGQQVAGVVTYGAPAQQQVVPTTPPAFDMNRVGSAPPPEAGGGKGAQLADMYGRLCIVFPLREETVPRNQQFITAEQRAAGNVNQQRLTATVVVLDSGPGSQVAGGTIAWGGKPHALPPIPHTNSDPLPYVRKSMWINQTQLIGQARAFLPQGPGMPPGLLAGRPVKTGPEHNAPWYLAPASDQEMTLVRQYLDLVNAGQFPHPLAP